MVNRGAKRPGKKDINIKIKVIILKRTEQFPLAIN